MRYTIHDTIVAREPVTIEHAQELTAAIEPWFTDMPEQLPEVLQALSDRLARGEYTGAEEAYLGLTVTRH